MKHRAIVIAFVFLRGVGLAEELDSRLALIAAEQERKAKSVKADQPRKIESGLLWFRGNNVLERLTGGASGLRPKLGGMGAGTGFGIGPEYERTDLLGGQLTFRASAQSSFQGDRRMDLHLSAPKLSANRYFAEFYAIHHDYPRINYYGPGPDSEKSGRTAFRFEDTAVDAAFGVRPLSRLKLGASAGYVFNNVGKGTDSRYASTELVYSPAQAPGIDVQSDFLRVGGFAHYDWRDNPDGPRRGGNYFVQFSDYRDRSFDLSNFRRLDLEAQQFIPLLNDRRVFGVRARSTLTYREGGRPLPFYMQPSLGGSEDLRGYRPYRFRGDNLMVMNAEYRWEVFSGLDMAVFGDAGKVFMRKGDLALGDLETDIGVGLRFNSRNRTFLRLDVGFSHEGFQVWVRFTDVFKRAPVLSSSNLGGI
jgi:outer membrane protein assembly factor BamA